MKQSFASGFALLTVLVFIVLLSILITSFLTFMQLDRSSTHNYSSGVKAQEMAVGALEEIVGDLLMELDAGSSADPKYVDHGVRVYAPSAARTAFPARIGFTPADYSTDVDPVLLPPSLLRVSRGDDPFYTTPPLEYIATKLPPNRASRVSSTLSSANGRRISGARWNKPQILGATVPSGFCSDDRNDANDRSPDWVFLTRAGSQVCLDSNIGGYKNANDPANMSAIVGRYAFVIYDQGGLLDINTSGYPTPTTTEATDAARGKSCSAFADLSALPGMLGRTVELDALVNWRSKGSIAASGAFPRMVRDWLKSGMLDLQLGDSPLVGRQDLLDYFKAKFNTTQPCAYLGTFSRSVNAPTWTPEANTSVINYKDNADDPQSVNRNLANVRFRADSNVVHYSDDANSTTYQVKAGVPMLQSRFSLARLGWLERANQDTGAGPAMPYTDAIKACFGLVWDYPGGSIGAGTTANGGNRCWNYVGATANGTNPARTIKTLDQVAAEGREPDFFELLKASILSGSVGRDPGPAAFDNTTSSDRFPQAPNNPFDVHGALAEQQKGPAGAFCYSFAPSGNSKAPARIPDMQIIQIGANMIDQFDSDSYPVAIYFKYQGVESFDPATGPGGHPLLGPVTMVYGNENLPYLTRMMQLNCSPARSGSNDPPNSSDDATTSLCGWRQPELWNPHQQPAAPLAQAPRNFQIRAYGSAETYWLTLGSAADPAQRRYGISQVVNYYTTNSCNEPLSAVGTINFSDSSTTSSFYAHPWLLTTDGIPGVTVTSPANTPAAPPSGDNIAKSNYPFYNTIGNSFNPYTNHFAAFSTGVTVSTLPNLSTDPYNPFYVTAGRYTNVGSAGVDTTGFGPVNTYTLGWLDSANRFHPYSFITGIFPYAYGQLDRNLSRHVGSVVPEAILPNMYFNVDPRTTRFSTSYTFFGQGQPYGSNTVYPRNGLNWYLTCVPWGTGFTWFQPSAFSLYGGMVRDWLVNIPNAPQLPAAPLSSYYSDPDGVVRPGDGLFANLAQGDGVMLFTSNAGLSGTAVGDRAGNVQHGRRPVILNRPFRSLGELGYVFRDLPFKSLDFFTNVSADAALLDVFCLTDSCTVANGKLTTVTAGEINPNSASAPVFRALLAGGSKKEIDATYNLRTEVTAMAQNFVRSLNPAAGPAPMLNRAGLVNRFGSNLTGNGPIRDALTSTTDKGNKSYLEAPVRALAGATSTRTWNLLIDVIAQSGQISPRATTLREFVVQGERRYWLHIAIDRYTGKIVDRQLEPVYE